MCLLEVSIIRRDGGEPAGVLGNAGRAGSATNSGERDGSAGASARKGQ